MNGERCGLSAGGRQNVDHVSKRDNGKDQEHYAYCPAAGREHQGQHYQTEGDVPDSLETQPC